MGAETEVGAGRFEADGHRGKLIRCYCARGVTVGPAYAQRYPERVTEMVLLSCTMTRLSDMHWLLADRDDPYQWQVLQDPSAEEVSASDGSAGGPVASVQKPRRDPLR